MELASSIQIRSLVKRAVERDNLNTVARTLETSRHAVMSYLTGKPRQGTRVLIESRAHRLKAG